MHDAHEDVSFDPRAIVADADDVERALMGPMELLEAEVASRTGERASAARA